MKFNKMKCQVPPLGRSNSTHHYLLGTNCVGSSFRGNDLGVLVDNKLNVIQQRAVTPKTADSLLGWIRQSITSGEVILPLHSALVRHTWRAGPGLRLPVQERQGLTGVSAVKCYEDD